MLATRKAAKRIVSEAERLGCEVIVMGGDPPRNRLLGDFIWSQGPTGCGAAQAYVITEDA